jgi:tRNA pseudouridine32 synthase/23S rRNA pseudouridine746 synthase
MEIIAIDPLFLVINKPSGLLSVPGRGLNMQDCVVSRIKALFPDPLIPAYSVL